MTANEVEEVIAQIRALPADKQRYVAEIIDVLSAQDDVPLSLEEIEGIKVAQAGVGAGKYASDAEVEAFFAKHHA